MKMRGLVTVLVFAAVSSFAVAEEKAATAAAPDRELGYAMGYHFGSQMDKEIEFFKTKNLPVDVSRFTKGLGDAVEKKTPEMTEEAIEAQLKAFGEKMQAAAAAEKAKADEVKAGDAKAGEVKIEEAKPETAAAEAGKPEVAGDKELGYAIGFKFGGQMERQLGFFRTKGADLDIAGFLKGVTDAVEKKDPEQSEDQRREKLQAFGLKMQAMAATENQDVGAAFLAENGKKEGVVTTASGLQYQVIKAGTGAKPTATDKVKVHYQGTLINGTVFDSSRTRGEPVTFAANQVIAGWTEALQLMPVGSTYKLAIPSNLAYGEQGAGQAIGPNSTLIFEVELLEIVK